MLFYRKCIGGFSFDTSYYPLRFHLKLTSYPVEFPFIRYWHKMDLSQDLKA